MARQTERQIPTSLTECAKEDPAASSLHDWAERLESWGGAILGILIVAGIISTIMAGTNAAEMDDDLVVTACLTSIVTWALYAFIEYAVFKALSMLIGALASITQNTAISANIALYNASRDCPVSNATQPKSSEKPQAFNQAGLHAETTPTTSENTQTKSTYIQPIASAPGTITCPNCGLTQRSTRQVCWSCNQKFKVE